MPVILTRDVIIILENLRENYFISGFIPSGRESRYVNRIFLKKSEMNRNWTGVVASKSSSSDGCGKVDLRQDSSRAPWRQNQPFPVCYSLHLDYAIPLSHSLACKCSVEGSP